MRLIAATLLAASCQTARSVEPSSYVDITTQDSIASAIMLLQVQEPEQLVSMLLDACGGCAWSIQRLAPLAAPTDSADTTGEIAETGSESGVVLSHCGNGRIDDGVLYIIPRRRRGIEGPATRACATLICDGDSETRRIWVAQFDGVWTLYPMEIPGN